MLREIRIRPKPARIRIMPTTGELLANVERSVEAKELTIKLNKIMNHRLR